MHRRRRGHAAPPPQQTAHDDLEPGRADRRGLPPPRSRRRGTRQPSRWSRVQGHLPVDRARDVHLAATLAASFTISTRGRPARRTARSGAFERRLPARWPRALLEQDLGAALERQARRRGAIAGYGQRGGSLLTWRAERGAHRAAYALARGAARRHASGSGSRNVGKIAAPVRPPCPPRSADAVALRLDRRPPLRQIAPATPEPSTSSLLAAFTMASTACSVMSPRAARCGAHAASSSCGDGFDQSGRHERQQDLVVSVSE